MNDDIDKMITELLDLAAPFDRTIYNILYRNAGWAIQWADIAQDKTVVHGYYRTLSTCLQREKERLEELTNAE